MTYQSLEIYAKMKFTSIDNLLKEINKTQKMISGILVVIEMYKTIIDPNNDLKDDERVKQFAEYLDFSEERIEAIYELGFIRLFAAFESFMYDYLKELYLLYPNSLPSDRKIDIGSLWSLHTQADVREFIVDQIAIEHSYEINVWENTLKNTFGIETFKDKDQKKGLLTLNLYRNMSMHAGGKFNSKTFRDIRKIVFGNKKKYDSTDNYNFSTHKIEVKHKLKFQHLFRTIEAIILHLNKVSPKPVANNME